MIADKNGASMMPMPGIIHKSQQLWVLSEMPTPESREVRRTTFHKTPQHRQKSEKVFPVGAVEAAV